MIHRGSNGRLAVAMMLFLQALNPSAPAQDSRPVLTIGQAEEFSIPFDVIDENDVGVTLVPDLVPRNIYEANREPLPRNIAELPDIVTIIAGNNSDDLVTLADRGMLEALDDVSSDLADSLRENLLPEMLRAVTYKEKI